MDDSHLCRANMRMRQTAQHSYVYNVPAALQAVSRQPRRFATHVFHVHLLLAVFSQRALCRVYRSHTFTARFYLVKQRLGSFETRAPSIITL